jgi:hypothetical protein
MEGWARVAWLVGLVTLLVAGCGRAASREAAGGHRLVHVHEFPDMGARIAPPTGRPRLSWRQALRPVLAWIVVYPDAEEVLFGPDFAPPTARGAGRCPAYVVVDATSGRGRGAFQTCEPPYRG